MAIRSVGIGTSVSIGAASVQTDYFDVQSDTIKITAVGGDCFVAVGNTPAATRESLYLAANTSMSLGMTKASQRVTGITTGTTETILSFPEGQQCPFGHGNYISVETGDGYAGVGSYLSHVRVISVNNKAGSPWADGCFMTQCTVAANSEKIIPADVDFADARAIASHRVAVIQAGTNAGAHIHCHQVQITGEG
tara:strand:- start:45 stop:626 length:582 start_codon:yes stop_codon:yes gene_type:complete